MCAQFLALLCLSDCTTKVFSLREMLGTYILFLGEENEALSNMRMVLSVLFQGFSGATPLPGFRERLYMDTLQGCSTRGLWGHKRQGPDFVPREVGWLQQAML